MKLPLLLPALLGLLSLHSGLRGEDFNISDWNPGHVAIIPGRNSEGSAILLSSDNPHGGKQCLKLVYNIQDTGYAEYNLNVPRQPPEIAAGGPVKISMWLRGDPTVKLAPMEIRLLDASGEVFQYALPGTDAVMQKTDWTAYTTQLDLDKPVIHFAGNNNGVVDYPVKLLSITLESREKGTNSGSIYLDGLQWEPAAP